MNDERPGGWEGGSKLKYFLDRTRLLSVKMMRAKLGEGGS